MVKKHNLKGIIKLVAVAVLLLVPAQTVFAATWSSSDNWGEWKTNGYTIRNDIWGEGAGPQSIWVNSESDWGVWSAHPNTGGIKSYPHAEKVINKNLSDIKTLTSNFNVTVPTNGVAMETAYDIWLNNNAYEVMLWMNSYGDVKPISYNYDSYGNAVPYYWGVPVGGHTWNVYRGNNGGNEVFSFVRVDGNISSGTVDLQEILNWIKDVPEWYGDVYLGQVQFGYEITSSYNNGNGYNFKTNNFSVYSE
ncbi:GH12 family glycosyl hydrolase domain-containing protein [Clostridium butyricum]|uniref:Glycosyl hydrolase n=1 Tax=Clostridium butyricum TaxID=1492 RepID=A0A2S7FBP8_CLOBU|nr:glycosyl hydrolase [Clostridium butyricum]KHD14019.1 glycosyl hydrolase [Clostridium butyricum]PPV15384.1 glycosyl hydrolase [Clostridium butyricum]